VKNHLQLWVKMLHMPQLDAEDIFEPFHPKD
jgi:hypothetical protein